MATRQTTGSDTPADGQPRGAIDFAFGIETLERLSRLDFQGHPVLSVYFDLDPKRFPTPAARDAQLGSLLDQARREGGERDADRIRAWLLAEPTIARGARGLAIFSCAPAGVLEAVRLADPVEPLVVIDAICWLEPLAAPISPGGWGVAIVSRRRARLLRGGSGTLTEFATVDDQLHRRHAQGGWSQSRYQRGIEEQVAAHVRGVTERLLRAHQRRPFEHLVIVCSDELRPVVEHELHSDLAAVVAGVIDADLEHASTQTIARAVAPVIDRVQLASEHDLIARLQQALGNGGPAAAGLDEVLLTLNERRVDTLLVPERSELKAWRCPACGRLWSAGGSCPLDGSELVQVDAVEYAVQEAARQSADVVVAHHESQWLGEHGEIAALLRW